MQPQQMQPTSIPNIAALLQPNGNPALSGGLHGLGNSSMLPILGTDFMLGAALANAQVQGRVPIPQTPGVSHYKMITLMDRNGDSILAEDEVIFKVLSYMLHANGIDSEKDIAAMPSPTTAAEENPGPMSRKLRKRRAPDIQDDGYRWRKYGQKMLQSGTGTMFRDYFRCPHPGCQSKKQVVFDGRTGEVISIHMSEHTHPPFAEDPSKRGGTMRLQPH